MLPHPAGKTGGTKVVKLEEDDSWFGAEMVYQF